MDADTEDSMTEEEPTREVDWEELRAAAVAAMTRAYAPYSRYRVGAAALVDDGRIVSGCNVENASYGLSLCAECGMISHLVATGGGRLVAALCVDGDEGLIMPCGRCRQLLDEHAAPGAQILTPLGTKTIAEVLPQAFGAHDIEDH
ncbi:MAG: cytidine deaminase [Ornithinimicrobium sp.]